MNIKKTKILCVLDGFGLSSDSDNNAVSKAKMPNFRKLLNESFWSTLDADGSSVGQERGLVGNSEVGHMNIGGLKLVPQLSYQITESAKSLFNLDSSLAPDQNFDPKDFLKSVFKNSLDAKTVHLIGLFSTGTIHSDLRHWAGAIQASGQAGAEKIVLHIISDGRDSDPKSLVETWGYFVDNFGKQFEEYKVKVFLGSVGGRFYAMDRDKNWDRVARGILSMFNLEIFGNITDQNYTDYFNVDDKFASFFIDNFNLKYQAIFSDLVFYRDNQYEKTIDLGEVNIRDDWQFDEKDTTTGLQAITKNSYSNQNYDENIIPKSSEIGAINKNECVFLINFRTDRFKQLTQMLCELNKEFKLGLKILGMNDYGVENLPASSWKSGDQINSDGYYAIFKNKPVQNTLADFIESKGQTQLHIAETEKYNHVTYFMNGGQNKKHVGEDWVLIDSNKVANHAEKPAMKAVEITDYIIKSGIGKYDYIIVNYANPDMVAHTGDFEVTVESLEILDKQLGRLVQEVQQDGHSLLITADHGNAEKVGEYKLKGKTLLDTEHNADPVPLILVQQDFSPAQTIKNIEKLGLLHKTQIQNLRTFLESQNQIKIDNHSWLNKEQIPDPSLPLWYAGLFLLSL